MPIGSGYVLTEAQKWLIERAGGPSGAVAVQEAESILTLEQSESLRPAGVPTPQVEIDYIAAIATVVDQSPDTETYDQRVSPTVVAQKETSGLHDLGGGPAIPVVADAPIVEQESGGGFLGNVWDAVTSVSLSDVGTFAVQSVADNVLRGNYTDVVDWVNNSLFNKGSGIGAGDVKAAQAPTMVQSTRRVESQCARILGYKWWS